MIVIRRPVVYSGGLLCLLVLTSTAAQDPLQLWTYFTNCEFLPCLLCTCNCLTSLLVLHREFYYPVHGIHFSS